MPTRNYKPEQIVAVLRQIAVREDCAPSLQRSWNPHANLLPVAEGIRRAEGGAGKTAQGTGDGEWAAEEAGGRVIAGEAGAWGCGAGKLLSPERRRCAVERAGLRP